MPALFAFLLVLLSPLLALAQAGAGGDTDAWLISWTFWGAILFGALAVALSLYFGRRTRGGPPLAP